MAVREFLAVVARAALQWALATLVLANGAAFCLVAAAASSLRLGPPCLLCARVHRLLGGGSSSSASASGDHDAHTALRRLLCDAHAAAVAVPACSASGDHDALRRLLCAAHTAAVAVPACSCSGDHGGGGTSRDDDSDKPGGLEAHRVVSIGSEICERDHGDVDDQQPARAADRRRDVARSTGIDGSGDPYVSLFELAPVVVDDAVLEGSTDGGHVSRELDELPELQGVGGGSSVGERRPTVGGLAAALRAQRRELEAVRAELEAERRARAEAVQRRRELEEQAEFDREAVRLAMQLVHETETEKHGLRRQLHASRVKSQLHEAAMDAASLPHGAHPRRRAGDETEEALDGNGDGGGGGRESSWNNNYQSLMDFMPGSVYSSSPDLANLLKLYTGGGDDDGSDLMTDAPAATVVGDDEVVAVTLAAAVLGSNGGKRETTAQGASP